MAKFMDLTGQQFDNWKVLKRAKNRDKCTMWKCQCICGTKKDIYAMHLRGNKSTKCRKCYENGHKNKLNCVLWGRVRWGAKCRNIKFKLTKEYLYNLFYKEQKELCALSGQKLFISNKIYDVCKNTTASLDRIDSTKDYIIGNVQWIHKDINKMKNNLNEQHFLNLCKSIVKFHKI